VCAAGRWPLAPVVGTERRQVTEVDVRRRVVEHRRCGCGQTVMARSRPGWARRPSTGLGVRALAVYLVVGQHVAVNRVAEFFRELDGITVSEGTLIAWYQQAAAGVLDHLGADTMLVHDFWAPYFGLDLTHAVCGAYLGRELVAAEIPTQHGWADSLDRLLTEIARTITATRDAGGTGLSPRLLCVYTHRYDTLIRAGWAANPDHTARHPRDRETAAARQPPRPPGRPPRRRAPLRHRPTSPIHQQRQ